MTTKEEKITPARVVALEVLERFHSKPSPADDLLDFCCNKQPGLSAADRGLAQMLVYGVLRWRRCLDDELVKYTKQGLPADNRLLNILRLALYQLRYLDKIPVSAAVNTAVEAAKSLGRSRQAGFVNAVLRRVARENSGNREPLSSASFPDWMLKVFKECVPKGEVASFLMASNQRAPVVLRVCDPKDVVSLKKKLEDALGQVESGRWCADALIVGGNPGAVFRWPGFLEGRFVVQDEAAQLITTLLAPEPGESILDVAAAPGGKSVHIAQCMEGKGRVVALDSDAKRLERVQQTCQRLGVGIVEPVHGDITRKLAGLEECSFDRVLVDAPCSALGILRKKPDIKWIRRASDLDSLAKKQYAMLEAAAGYVKPGGVLVYSVCTVSKKETTDIVDVFTREKPGFLRDKSWAKHSTLSQFQTTAEYFRAWPHIHGTDGFFGARWRFG